MVLHFKKSISESLENIHSLENLLPLKYHQLPIYDAEVVRTHVVSDAVIEQYGNAKWAIIDLLNEEYGAILFNKFDLHHWLEKNQDDEAAYFLNEAGSNSLNYSQFLAPLCFHLWLGKKGFVIGIEQKGKGFNAIKINEEKIKEHQGGAFTFFRGCKNMVFFDNADDARIVYLEVIF